MRIDVGPPHSMLSAGCCRPGCTSTEIVPEICLFAVALGDGGGTGAKPCAPTCKMEPVGAGNEPGESGDRGCGGKCTVCPSVRFPDSVGGIVRSFPVVVSGSAFALSLFAGALSGGDTKNVGIGIGGSFASGCPNTDCPKSSAAKPVPDNPNSVHQ